MGELDNKVDEILPFLERVRKKLKMNVQVLYHDFSDSYTLRVKASNFSFETKEEVIEALNELEKTGRL